MPAFEGPSRKAGASTDQRIGRRGIEDIMANILTVCRRGERKTKIMYGSMVNLRQLNRYLGMLLTKGLLMKDQATGEYRTTVRGARYLSDYDNMVRHSREMSNLHKELIGMLPDEVIPGA